MARVRRQGTYFLSSSTADPPLSHSRVWLSQMARVRRQGTYFLSVLQRTLPCPIQGCGSPRWRGWGDRVLIFCPGLQLTIPCPSRGYDSLEGEGEETGYLLSIQVCSGPSPVPFKGVALPDGEGEETGYLFSVQVCSGPSPVRVAGMTLWRVRVRRQGTYFPSRSAADPPLSESRVWLSGRSTLDVVLLTWCSLSDPPCCFLPSCDFGWATCRIRSPIQWHLSLLNLSLMKPP